jgi:hypothetical protein
MKLVKNLTAQDFRRAYAAAHKGIPQRLFLDVKNDEDDLIHAG